MATYGKYPVDWSKEEMLRAAVPSYDIGMYEQNMLVWRLMNEPDIMAKVTPPQSLTSWRIPPGIGLLLKSRGGSRGCPGTSSSPAAKGLENTVRSGQALGCVGVVPGLPRRFQGCLSNPAPPCFSLTLTLLT